MAPLRLLRLKPHFPPFNYLHNRHNPNPNHLQFSRHFQPPFLNPPKLFHSFLHHHQLSPPQSSPSEPDTNPPSIDHNPRVSLSISNSNSNSTNPNSKTSDHEDQVNSIATRPYTLRGRAKKGKSKEYWVCSECGHSEAKWWGACTSCKQFGTLKPFSVQDDLQGGKVSGFSVSDNVLRGWLPEEKGGESGAGPVRLVDVNQCNNHDQWRIQLYGTFGGEVARVLGGGVVPGSLILVGGDPGVGKSTLALQLAALIAEGCDISGAAPVIYISGEESVEQIGNRADRLSIMAEDLFLYSSTDVEDILEKVQVLRARAVVIDSIQTVYLKGVAGSPGGMVQVKECTAAFLRFAKKSNIPVLLIGHVTKSGDVAGPKLLEHIVDVVLYMEGERQLSHRLLRAVKNRFGSTDELGVFEMSEVGLLAVSNPSEMFLSQEHSESEHLAGLAVAVIVDGSRTFALEVQALCVTNSVGGHTNWGQTRKPSVEKHLNGVQASRADMIISVLKKQAGLKMDDYSIFVNVVSGVSLTETSGDLAVAAAICSSYLEFPIPNYVAFIGEIGLGGELRMVSRMEKRVQTLAKLGYKTCVVPKLAEKSLAALNIDGLQIVACRNLKEVIDTVFRNENGSQ